MLSLDPTDQIREWTGTFLLSEINLKDNVTILEKNRKT
jgi:hypothetical protein